MITLSEALSNFSGTTNYVAKYTPTGNVLGISQIFDNGTNVGIGTSTPSTKLQIVAGNNQGVYSTSTNDIAINGTATGSNSYGIKGETDLGTAIRSNITNTSAIGLEVNYTPTNTSLFKVLGDGNVGIGTASPTSKLQIVGTDSTSSNYSLKIDNSASSPLLYVRNDGYFNAGNGNLVSFDNGSYISIGTSALSSGRYRSLSIGPEGQSWIYFDISSTFMFLSKKALIGGTSTSIGSGNEISIADTGRLGVTNIGFNNNPNNGETNYAIGGENFSLNPTIKLSFQPNQFGLPLTGTSANNGYRIGIGANSVSTHRLIISDGLKLISTSYNTTSFDIIDSLSSPLFNVQNGGNVGIGTSTPSEKLEVNGNIKTAQPSANGAGAWKLGKKVTATVSLVTTDYIEVEIDSVVYKLALVS